MVSKPLGFHAFLGRCEFHIVSIIGTIDFGQWDWDKGGG